jgi:hypothetical protein
MEQLTNALDYRRLQLARLLKKVKIKLSRQQLEALWVLLKHDLAAWKPTGIHEKSSYLLTYRIFRKIDQAYLQNLGKMAKLSFDLIEAAHFYDLREEFELSGIGEYEQAILRDITFEIQQQTC